MKSFDSMAVFLESLTGDCECDEYWVTERRKLFVPKREDGIIILNCLRCNHENNRGSLDFEVSQEDVDCLGQEFREYVLTNSPGVKDKSIHYSDFREGMDIHDSRLRAVSKILDKGCEIETTGPCYMCCRDVKISLRNGGVWYSCSPCAEMMD